MIYDDSKLVLYFFCRFLSSPVDYPLAPRYTLGLTKPNFTFMAGLSKFMAALKVFSATNFNGLPNLWLT